MAETTGTRRAGRTVGSAALTVTVGVAVNQILDDGKFSWTWLYVSLAVAVLAFLYSESVPRARAGDGRGGRRVYLRQLRESVRDMETVGIATHSEFVLRMHQVYVDVSLAPETVQAAAAAPYLGVVRDDEAAGRGRRRTLASVLEDAEQADATRILAVIGGPGSGKTTLARNTALALCERGRRPWARRLPVLLYLRDHAAALLAEEPPPLADVAVSAGWLEGKVSAEWLTRRLDAGRCLVLLDGLDEVADPADRSRVVAWAVRQTQRHPHNVYVVTSRPYGYQSNPLPGAEVLQVRRFTGDQISRYLHQWHYAMESRARALTRREARAAADGPLTRLRTRADTDRLVRAAADRSARDLLARLRAESALYDLASNPLLLTMIANVHRYRGELPGTRAGLYAEMCDVLLHRRYEVRGLRDATGLSGPHKQHVIQHLALAMMRARVRDWPAADAARAIRRPLRQVPGGVTPEVFLEEARKSGLLVERDHGFYGFAHLTLQEYLAAALLSTPRADTGLLTGNVDDPWYRETVLLWCAGNDATDVITACLDTGSVPALALAADCVDQARTVDPAVRARLEETLAPPSPGAPHAPDRERLLAGIQATRFLRETVPLGDAAALCTRPVPRTLYDFFVREERAAGRHHPYGVGGPGDLAGVGDGVAVGMGPGDAERFVAWLNALTGSGALRLPAPEELPRAEAAAEPDDPSGAPAAWAAALTGRTLWVQDGQNTLLHQPPGTPWPYEPSLDQIVRSPASDRREATRRLRLLVQPPGQQARVEGWVRVVISALVRAAEPPADPALARLRTVIALSAAHSLAGARARIADMMGLISDTTVRAQLGALADSLASRETGDILHALASATALVSGQASIRADSPHRPHGTIDVRSLRPADVYAPGLADDLARARVLCQALGPALGQALDDAPTDAPGTEHALAAGLDLLEADPVGVLGPAVDFRRTLGSALAPSVAEALALSSGATLDPDHSRGETLDAALDHAISSHDRTLETVLAGFRMLSTVWAPSSGEEVPSPTLALDGLLQDRIPEWVAAFLVPEDPTVTLRRTYLQMVPSVSRELVDRGLVLVELVLELLTAVRDRTAPSDARTMSCARFALNAATTSLRLAGAGKDGATRLLHEAWLSLVAQDRTAVAGSVPPNQILMIVRDDDVPRHTQTPARPAGA
ncbi:NACHT domain-containing protein [Streptomyces sp. NPDC101118]|uniref:NACHT domain-containing protein n=1 Tax=Streptomyces sp. NPDC101118 TaxID=3366109 RepID=UPI0037FC4F5F